MNSHLPTEITEFDITGIPEALANLTERGALDPVVKFTVALSDSGLAQIQDTIAYGEIKDGSITGGSPIIEILPISRLIVRQGD